MRMAISSPAFRHEEPILERFTCDGEDVSPPLHWTGVPEASQTLALIVEDPDAPDPAAPQHIFTHWIIYNLPPDSTGLVENVTLETLPRGARFGQNDFERTRWGGPCPPTGRHRYYFKLYALDSPVPTAHVLTRSGLLAAIDGHVLRYAELIGTYEKRSASSQR